MEKFRMKHLSFSSISSFISRLTRASLWKNFLYQLHWRTKKLTVPITVKTMIAIFPQKASPFKKLKITKWLISSWNFQLEIFKPTGIYIYVYINKMTKSDSFLRVQCAESSHFGDFRILPNFPNSPSNFHRDENLDI